ncbi:hypothetical protein DYB32_010814 [Aphanomyces invadans]|uniref:HAT C-terminal dimerisation domain-containing protein n=1 Tax=Aphanomyces invadans TaxID=157072 RepID=A0A3R6YVV0_9STRA|nr:hypothetical protein DYB32_010814 [Aphanomyces invadans]
MLWPRYWSKLWLAALGSSNLFPNQFAISTQHQVLTLAPLKPKVLQATRWSSAYEMLVRFQKLLPSLQRMPKRAKLKLPSKSMLKRLERSIPLLTKWQSVTKYLQRRDCTSLNVRVIFDKVLAEWPSMASRLGSTASIVHSKDFEDAVVALQRRVVLSAADKVVLENFKVPPTNAPSQRNRTAATFSEDAVADGIVADGVALSNDPILMHLPPTSNGVERFFSAAKQLLGTQRKAMSSANIEVTLFLKVNARFWDINKITTLVAADTSGVGHEELSEGEDDDDDDDDGCTQRHDHSDASDSDQDMGHGFEEALDDGDSSDESSDDDSEHDDEDASK